MSAKSLAATGLTRRSTANRTGLIAVEIGIEGTLTGPSLPHHRTSGSAYGGSVVMRMTLDTTKGCLAP